MPPKDESTAGGLLSRVVRFVRNPGASWGELSEQEGDRESSYSKQLLKEMIERKRRNDFVRKREFDMLRKMRRSEVLAGQDLGARPSFFQSSMPSRPDDRATTLKKIDEIEAQMSMQWWKNKHGEPGGNGSGFPVSSHVPPEPVRNDAPGTADARAAPRGRLEVPADPAPSEPLLDSLPPAALTAHNSARPPLRGHGTPAPAAPLPPAPAPVAVDRPAPSPAARVSSSAPAQLPAGQPASAPAAAVPARREAAASAAAGPASAFSASRQFAIDVEEFAHDPELEEAAIRFANGDNAGAEAGLLEVLKPNGTRVNHEETWLTLFDLYRATGQQERYEPAAIDFASRFGRSAPQWFSLPEIVGRIHAPAANQGGGAGQPIADWTSPPQFGTQTLATLNAALAKAAPPYRLNWSKLTSIADGAVEPLTRLFTQWAASSVQLRFIGADVLDRVLRAATPSGDRAVNPAWWQLRLEVLRVMHRPDEFELVALDYCVTYEVSPPSWDSSRCEYKPLQADGSYAAGHTIVGDAFRDSMVSLLTGYGDSHAPSVLNSQMASVVTVDLSGQVLDDGKEALEMLQGKLQDADVMVVSCARLIRIDFTAAGTLLNWVTARQAEGRQLQFVEVHRLVAAFFHVIGISEHARVTVRHE